MSRASRGAPTRAATAALLLTLTACGGGEQDPGSAPTTPSRPATEASTAAPVGPTPAGRVPATVSAPSRVRSGQTVTLRLGVGNPRSAALHVVGGACHPHLGVVITTSAGVVVREPAADDPCPTRDLVVPAGGTTLTLPLQATWNVCATASAPRPGAIPCPPERSIPRLPAGSYLVTVRSDALSVLEPARITVTAPGAATGTTVPAPTPSRPAPAASGAAG